MNVTGTASLSTFPAVVNATTAEESLRLAMGESYVPMPVVLVGTTNLAGEENVKIVHEPVVESVEAEETEGKIIDVIEDVILEDVTTEGELNEVIHFTEDSEGVVSVLVKTEDGGLFYITEGDWAAFYGEDGEMELLTAYDRASIMALRKSHNLIAA